MSSAAALRETLAPQLRIRRRTAWQRRYAERAERAVLDLLRHAAHGQASALQERLGPLRQALFRSPHYAETLRHAGLSPRDLQSLDDLPYFPLLDRQTLQRRRLELPALQLDSLEAREAVFVQSSGSSGDSVSILKDPYDCLHMWAVLRFLVRFHRVALPRRPRVVLLCSLTNGIEYSLRLPLLEDGVLHRISLARERPLDRLRRARPDVVFSDPAGLHWLAAQKDAPVPRLILTSAQYFSPEQRARLGRSVPAPVVNYYASSDAGPIAWECLMSPGRFHMLLPDVWLETVAGELVLTRLRGSVLPLLRYRTGDHGGVVPEACRCGYRGFSVVGFTGRRQCLFAAPGGRSVDAWRLVWIFKHYPLRGFRLTQRTLDTFELELQRDGDAALPPDLALRLRRALQLLGFDEPRIELRAAEVLWSSGDKPEPFRCLARFSA